MPFNIANALNLQYPDPIGIDQLKQRNALAQRDQQMQEQTFASNQNQLARQNSQEDAALEQRKHQEAAQWMVAGAKTLRAAGPDSFNHIADMIANDPRAQYLGVTRDHITPEGMQTLLAHAQVQAGEAPPPQFEGSLEQQKLAAEQSGRQDLENLRYQHDRSVAGMGAGSKPQLVDVQMPDGSTQKQWLTPGQGNGTNVGAPKPALPKPRSLSQKSIDSLGGAGEGVVNFTRLTGTFKDEFGGKGLAVIGNAENAVRRNLTGDSHGQADWWADYQNQKNLIRNKLFGSALTATEKTEFEKATINPGMRPELIRKNIARQQAVVERALERLSGAYEKGGYSREQIDAASGMDVFKSEQAPAAGAYADAAKEARYQAWKAKQGGQP